MSWGGYYVDGMQNATHYQCFSEVVEQTRKTAKELVNNVPDETEARAAYDNTKRRASERNNAEIDDQNDGWRSDAFNL